MAISDIVARLSRFSLFAGFSSEALVQVGNFVEEKAYPARTMLFRQGDQPDFFYLVESGTVEEVGRAQDGTVVLRRKAGVGEFVGRRSLIDRKVRQATAIATQPVELLVINAHNFHILLSMFPRLRDRLLHTRVVNRLLTIPLFSCFSIDKLMHVAELAQLERYAPGDVVLHQGDPAEAFYVIDTGQVEESVVGTAPGTQTWPKYLAASSFFGRYALLHDTVQRATAKAITDLQVYRFSREDFQWLQQLNPEFEAHLKRFDMLHHLSQTPIFAKLDEEELKLLAGHVGLAHHRPGEILFRQGEMDPTLYILYEGVASAAARDEHGVEQQLGTLRAGDTAGESSLFLNEPRDVTVVSMSESNWLYLSRDDLNRFFAWRPEVEDKLVLKEEVRVRLRLKPFPWMDPDEQVELMRRRHPFALIDKVAIPTVILLLSLVLLLISVGDITAGLVRAIGFFILTLGSLWMVWGLIDWYNDHLVVTTKRVVHREKLLWVRETRDETPLDKVQNVNVVRGPLGNWFGFGTLMIDTAAAIEASRVEFTYLADPLAVQGLILEQVSRVQARRRLATRRVIRDKLEGRVSVGIHPRVPPVATAPVEEGPLTTTKRGVLRYLYESTWNRMFWGERVEGDQIIWRKHWWRLIWRIWIPSLMILGILLAYPFFVAATLARLPLLAAVLLPFVAWWLWGWADWGNDLYIVTYDRIIDTDKLPLGFRTLRTETSFDRIQNVSYKIPNPIANILNYGTVLVYTAGVEGELSFEWVSDPRGVQREIFRRLTLHQEQQQRQQWELQALNLPEWFAVYDETRPS